MYEIIPYNKPLGISPLEAIQKIRSDRPELKDQSITYAGRLDPMATGLLLLLTGDAVHDKQQYLDLPKTYQAKILLGISSDSYDILGLAKFDASTIFTKEEILNKFTQLKGNQTFPYPPFSSKPVSLEIPDSSEEDLNSSTKITQPLWLWAKQGRLDEIKIPLTTNKVLQAKITNLQIEHWSEIYQFITERINLVNGDFRQSEILNSWDQLNQTTAPEISFQIVEATFEVSSGTYIRTLADHLGKLLSTGGLLLSLNRSKIGNYENPTAE